ncbi:Phosphoserine aminotransferase [invertebrate metagenome]|uniref:phosphoserine transaminase n=1 Tax=invertebrate metagenome TaxID=1711999 RepID=A0A2H9T8X1_9ZZZZ
MGEFLGLSFQPGERCCNFSAGPAAIPQEVLEQARDELLNWHGEGASVMEISHRGTAFMAMAEKAEKDIRDLMAIPGNYKVLFLQGGARGQFSAVPMNIGGKGRAADYINSGYWAKSAITEAQHYLHVNIAADGKPSYSAMEGLSQWRLNPDAAYVHYTTNETIGGLQFSFIPETGDVPLVADMSSDILSGPIDVNRFGIIYAGAQKNIGPAGLTIVIVREDLIGQADAACPAVMNYASQAERDSMYNTPPTFAWYLASLVFQWLKKQGGLEAIAQVNARKAAKLYQCIDASGFYDNNVEKDWRSRMNVPFILADSALDTPFLAEAEKEGLCYLKGHKAVGGMRASIYNAVPEKHVDYLVSFMQEFERRYG